MTTLVVQDILGGDIAKTDVDGAWHFYNLLNGERLDFSESQFSQPVPYSDLPSNRGEAFSDTSQEQYQILRDRLLREVDLDTKPALATGAASAV